MQQHANMSDRRPISTTQNIDDSAPGTRKAVKFITAATIGTILLGLSGLTLTGTVICLILATPLLVIFSPVLVPATITAFLLAAGFLFSGGCGVAATSAVTWLYSYLKGKHPLGADQLDRAKEGITGMAKDVKERSKEYGQHKAQD